MERSNGLAAASGRDVRHALLGTWIDLHDDEKDKKMFLLLKKNMTHNIARCHTA